MWATLKYQEKTSFYSMTVLIALILLIGTVIGGYYWTTDDTNDTIQTDIDWHNPPCSPDNLSHDWKEITHPKMREFSNRREFVYKDTDIKIAFDKARPNTTGFEGKDHWHRYNPLKTNDINLYLDRNGNVVSKNSDPSHIETGCK
jgi:hypothetical protein